MSRPSQSPSSGRSRLPDVMIGGLALILLSGFGMLLVGQRQPVQTETVEVTPIETPPVIPGAPGNKATVNKDTMTAPTPSTTAATSEPQASTPTPTTTPTTEANTAATTSAQPQAEAVTPQTPPATTEPQEATPQTPTTTTTLPTTPTTTVPVVPAEPIKAAPAEPELPDPAAQIPAPTTPATQPTTATPTAQPEATATTPTAPATAPAPAKAVPTSEQRTPLRSDYRISLGSFQNTATAQSNTQSVAQLGYTIHPIDLGSEVVAQVGPFADEASAQQALAQIRQTYPNAILYPPRNRSLSQGNTAPAQAAAPATNQIQTQTAPAVATPAPAPSSPTYLQVGAFDRQEGAQKMVQSLRDLGYIPTVVAPNGGRVSVRVGPYTGDALLRTEKRLSDNGYDHFRVR